MDIAQKTELKKTNGWDALIDITKYSIDKGQILPAGIVFFFLIMAYNLDSDQSSLFLSNVLTYLSNGSIIGWALLVIAVSGWVYTNKTLRKRYEAELTRVANEKNSMQQERTTRQLRSSK